MSNNYNNFSKHNNFQRQNGSAVKQNFKPVVNNVDNNLKAAEPVEEKVIAAIPEGSNNPVVYSEHKTVEPVKERTVEATGIVTNVSLNIRKYPSLDGEILCVVKAGTKLLINLNESAEDWLKVSTPNNVRGFCMKEFVEY